MEAEILLASYILHHNTLTFEPKENDTESVGNVSVYQMISQSKMCNNLSIFLRKIHTRKQEKKLKVDRMRIYDFVMYLWHTLTHT